MAFYGGMSLNTGNYYGGGYTTGGYSGSRKITSSSNFNTMARNIAAGYAADMEIIQKYFEEGKTDKAIDKYESLFSDIRTTTGNYSYSLTDSEIQSILNASYENVTGSKILDSIEKNTDNSFITGLKQSIPIIGLFCNDVSDAEAIAKISGDKVSLKDKVLEFAGLAVGTAVTFCLGGWLLKGVGSLVGAGANILSKLKIVKTVNDVTKLTSGAKVATGVLAAGQVASTAVSVAEQVTDSL